MISFVKKRSGEKEPFDLQKLKNSIFRAMCSTGTGSDHLADEIADAVIFVADTSTVPSEDLADGVENALMSAGEHRATKEYIIYKYKEALKAHNIEV